LRLAAAAVAVAIPALSAPQASAAPLLLAVARTFVTGAPATGEPALDQRLAPRPAKDFAASTAACLGNRIAGRVMLSPVVREPIAGGAMQIAGRFTR
jgi:hypothetical protein